MGSQKISFRRENNPGLSDYQLAENLSAIEPREGAIIVRYKSSPGGIYDHFGSCGNDEMLRSYFSSSFCHDTEILYVHPLVPLHTIPSGLRIIDDAPKESCVYKLKQLEEKRLKDKKEARKRRKVDEENRRVEEEKKRKVEEEKRKVEEEKRMVEEEKRMVEEEKISRIQSDRHSLDQCIMCGQPLNFFRRLFGANRHTNCTSFKE